MLMQRCWVVFFLSSEFCFLFICQAQRGPWAPEPFAPSFSFRSASGRSRAYRAPREEVNQRTAEELDVGGSVCDAGMSMSI